MQSEIEFLGRIVSAEGMKPSKSKTEAISAVPHPTNLSELKSFFGMLNYYHDFLPNLSTTLEPLHRLLRKSVTWNWSKDCQAAFVEAKILLCSSDLLVLFDTSKPLV